MHVNPPWTEISPVTIEMIAKSLEQGAGLSKQIMDQILAELQLCTCRPDDDFYTEAGMQN